MSRIHVKGAILKMSDKNQKLAEIFLDYLNAQEASCVNARRQIGEPTQQKTVPEQAFSILHFEEHTGTKLAEFGTAEKSKNKEEDWLNAFNILKASDATINKRFHGSGFECSYWTYNERIFRQKLKNPT
jgi:hypothetical protein